MIRSETTGPPEGSPCANWLTPSRFGLLLSLLIAGTFPGILTGLTAFAYGDAAQFAYPVAYHHRVCFWNGELPLWNVYNNCGIPFLAQWNTLTLYPLSLIYLLLPLPWSYGLFCLIHCWIAGMGSYCLARHWTGSQLGAAVSGTAFAFNGLIWHSVIWPHFLAGLAWMPWVILAVAIAIDKGKRSIFLAALAAGLQLLSGGAEVVLQTWMFLGFLVVVTCCQSLPTVNGLPERQSRGKFILSVIVQMLSIGVLATAIAAVQLLPFFQLLAQSQRTGGFATTAMSNIASMPMTGWANYFVPLFRCLPNPNGVMVQAGQSWTASYYLGIGVLALSLFGVFRVRTARVLMLAGISILGLLLALGPRGVVYDWVKTMLPFLGMVRFPVKFVVLPTFALPLIAAYGVAWLAGSRNDQNHSWRKVLVPVIIVVTAILMITLLAWMQPLPGVPVETSIFSGLTRLVLLMLFFVTLFLINRQTRTWLVKVAPALLVILMWVDIRSHSSDLSPTVRSGVLEAGIVREFFGWNDTLTPARSRAMLSPPALTRMISAGMMDLETDVNSRRLALFMNLNLLDGVPKFDGFHSMDLKEWLDIFKHLYFTTNEAAGLKNFMGISHVSHPTNAVDWVKRTSPFPMVTAGQRPIFKGPEETLRAILQPTFDPQTAVYLPPAAAKILQSEGTAAVKVRLAAFTASRIELESEATSPSLVVIAQSYYPSWRADVDGRPAQLWRANYAFQAVEVPAGQHRLTLTYRDKDFVRGAAISGAALAFCLSGVFLFRGPRRRLPASARLMSRT